MTKSSLTPHKQALARRHAYTVLSRIFRDGLTPTLLPFAQQISQLAPLLPDPYDPDEAAAAHHRVFSLNIFPFESFFLDESGLLGGPAAARVQAAYEAAGFRPGDDAAPDHVGYELALLGFLAGAEADAWEDGQENIAGRMAQLQHDFLVQHLLRWLPPLVIALRRLGDPFYVALGNLALDFSVAHLKTYGGAAAAKPGAFLPEPPPLLADEKTGLRDIADYLTTPSYSGFFISREDVGRLAQRQELPRGFGKRGQLLVNALRAAAQYETLPAFLADLAEMAGHWQNAYRILRRTHPPLVFFLRPWREQTAVTQSLLAQIRDASAGPEEEE